MPAVDLQIDLPALRRRRPDRPGLRRGFVGVLGAAIVAAGILVAISGGGQAGADARITTADIPSFQGAIAARMHAQHLSYKSIVCLRSGREFNGVAVVRCNVDFGDPHVVAYCSVLRGGRLVTSQDDAAIPCGHDDAGYSATIVQYG